MKINKRELQKKAKNFQNSFSRKSQKIFKKLLNNAWNPNSLILSINLITYRIDFQNKFK